MINKFGIELSDLPDDIIRNSLQQYMTPTMQNNMLQTSRGMKSLIPSNKFKKMLKNAKIEADKLIFSAIINGISETGIGRGLDDKLADNYARKYTPNNILVGKAAFEAAERFVRFCSNFGDMGYFNVDYLFEGGFFEVYQQYIVKGFSTPLPTMLTENTKDHRLTIMLYRKYITSVIFKNMLQSSDKNKKELK
jgi:hypothetical protein